jgi:cyclic-di-GMP phosphodiesterase TipF (flagellum assembly factor)
VPVTNALIVATYVMAAATAGVWLRLLGVDAPMAALIAVVQILVSVQIHSGFLRRRDRRVARRELSALKQAGSEFSHGLDDMRAKMDVLRSEIEAKTSAQSRKIISELRVLEQLMQDFAAKIAEKAKAVPPPEEEQPLEERASNSARSHLDTLGQSDLLEIIRASLEENRVDLYLQPIVTLPQRKLRFYEALSRLRAEDGTVIMPAQYIKVAAPVGLMSVVDNLLLFRCVQIVRRMMQKSRDMGVFCNISGDTLADAEFFPQFLEYMHHNRDLAGQIVFEFAQGSLAEAGAVGEENLSYLASLGFALSMDHVESLAIDFRKLHALGFRYIKVRAETLVNGMAGAGAAVAAEDLKKLLARHGLNLIAERVESEKTVVQLLDFNVDFGQGYLFGEPRAMRDEPKEQARLENASPVIPFRKAG